MNNQEKVTSIVAVAAIGTFVVMMVNSLIKMKRMEKEMVDLLNNVKEDSCEEPQEEIDEEEA